MAQSEIERLRTVALQVTARPVDTFYQPDVEKPLQGPSELMQLAGALSSLTPQVEGILDRRNEAQIEQAKRSAAAEQVKYKFANQEAFKKAVAEGTIDWGDNPWLKHYVEQEVAVDEVRNKRNDLWVAFEKSPAYGSQKSEDVAAFANKFYADQGIFTKYQGDALAQAADEAQKSTQWLVAGHAELQRNLRKDASIVALKDRIASASSPEEIAAIAKEAEVAVPRSELNAAIVDAAATAALTEKDPEAFTRIVSAIPTNGGKDNYGNTKEARLRYDRIRDAINQKRNDERQQLLQEEQDRFRVKWNEVESTGKIPVKSDFVGLAIRPDTLTDLFNQHNAASQQSRFSSEFTPEKQQRLIEIVAGKVPVDQVTSAEVDTLIGLATMAGNASAASSLSRFQQMHSTLVAGKGNWAREMTPETLQEAAQLEQMITLGLAGNQQVREFIESGKATEVMGRTLLGAVQTARSPLWSYSQTPKVAVAQVVNAALENGRILAASTYIDSDKARIEAMNIRLAKEAEPAIAERYVSELRGLAKENPEGVPEPQRKALAQRIAGEEVNRITQGMFSAGRPLPSQGQMLRLSKPRGTEAPSPTPATKVTTLSTQPTTQPTSQPTTQPTTQPSQESQESQESQTQPPDTPLPTSFKAEAMIRRYDAGAVNQAVGKSLALLSAKDRERMADLSRSSFNEVREFSDTFGKSFTLSKWQWWGASGSQVLTEANREANAASALWPKIQELLDSVESRAKQLNEADMNGSRVHPEDRIDLLRDTMLAARVLKQVQAVGISQQEAEAIAQADPANGWRVLEGANLPYARVLDSLTVKSSNSLRKWVVEKLHVPETEADRFILSLRGDSGDILDALREAQNPAKK